MKIIDFWKQEVNTRTHYSQYNKEEFIHNLNGNVPDWKEQIKDKSIWSDLHSQGNNINETCYTKVIIETLGCEFACFLIEAQWDKRHLDAGCALDYCACRISSNWYDFTVFTKEKILLWRLQEFLRECETNIELWKSLTDKQKAAVIKNVTEKEEQYFSDLLMYNIWKNELSFKKSPYIVFMNDRFQKTATDIMHHQDDHQNIDFAEHYLQGWDIPQLQLGFGDQLQYRPSERITILKRVIQLANEEDNLSMVEMTIRDLNNRMMFSHHF